MSETLWARCIRRAASESLIETQREEADTSQALWGQWKSHVSVWAFPDPRVRDVKFHNAVISWQNLNKLVILTPHTLHLFWKMAYVWTSGMCLWTTVHLTKPLPDIWTTVTSHFKGYAHIFRRSCRCVCSVSIILILNSTEGNVLITRIRDHQAYFLHFPQHVKVTHGTFLSCKNETPPPKSDCCKSNWARQGCQALDFSTRWCRVHRTVIKSILNILRVWRVVSYCLFSQNTRLKSKEFTKTVCLSALM